jgi:hypothetical protein
VNGAATTRTRRPEAAAIRVRAQLVLAEPERRRAGSKFADRGAALAVKEIGQRPSVRIEPRREAEHGGPLAFAAGRLFADRDQPFRRGLRAFAQAYDHARVQHEQALRIGRRGRHRPLPPGQLRRPARHAQGLAARDEDVDRPL